jgi:O-methyltransferase involved in polyketide biosynthesis
MLETGRDALIRETNSDAINCKLSAVNAGYLQDDFVSIFLKKTPNKAPVMNRGTYTRTYGIDKVVNDFLTKNGTNSQIISLGAGSDTRFFNFKSKQLSPKVYVEIDFEQITAKKTMSICKNKKTLSLLSNHKIIKGGTELVSDEFWLLSGDLRDFKSILDRMFGMGIDIKLSTLFISECVLIYIDPVSAADQIISLASTFENVQFITYEPILPDDVFGETMIKNLKNRGLELPGLFVYPSLEAQETRYKNFGFQESKAMDLNTVWDNISADERERISKLEIFDEVEEWHLMQSHYCLVVSIKN